MNDTMIKISLFLYEFSLIVEIIVYIQASFGFISEEITHFIKLDLALV